MKITASILFSILISFPALFAQAALETIQKSADLPAQLAQTIRSEDLKNYLTVLASDDFEGRETGEPGQKKAADFIAGKFREFGVPPLDENGNYFQKIAFINERWNRIALTVNNRDYRHLYDFYSFPSTNSSLPDFKSKSVIFLGYGIDDPKYSDYTGQNVKGKTIMIYAGEPKNQDGIYWVSGTSEASEWSGDFRKKLEAAKKNGVKLVLIIDADIQKNISDNRSKIVGGGNSMGESELPETRFANNVFISPTVAKAIIGDKMGKVVAAREQIQSSGKPKPAKLKCNLQLFQDKLDSRLAGENVLGYIEGTDPALKKELVVVTAHYDHLGKKGSSIFNGADDNGSGTSTVLEIAQAFAEAKKSGVGPKRSVLCMLVSGEEKGLLGSKYYVEHPVFPLENTIVNINVDMVGRIDAKYAGNPDYIYVIGADRLSSDLHAINERMNEEYTQLTLDYTYNAESDPNRYYYRSDHYNFAEKGIPAIFYFNGTHDDYHRSTDTIDKINFEKMEKIGRLIFHTAWEVTNRSNRIRVDKAGTAKG